MNQKQFEFTGKPGGYLVVFIVTLITAYIPILGWPIGFNFVYKWIADNALISGRKVKYEAGYGETLVFLLVNLLLVMVTFGIYTFWYIPKTYRYIAAHTSFIDTPSAAAMPISQPMQPTQPMLPEQPVQPAQPSAPMNTAPADPTQQPPTNPVQ